MSIANIPRKSKQLVRHLSLQLYWLSYNGWHVDRCLQRLGGLPRGLTQAPQRNSPCREPSRASSVRYPFFKCFRLASSCLLVRQVVS